VRIPAPIEQWGEGGFADARLPSPVGCQGVRDPLELQKLKELNEKRRAIRPLLSPTDPADAVTSYYALWHDPRRTQLTLHRDARGTVDGFIAVCQTGVDLFRPLVTLRAPDERTAVSLLSTALAANRPYQVLVPITLGSAVRSRLEMARSALLQIYRLDPSRFEPVLNVLVQRVTSADGTPRFQIESQGEVVAMSGTNWRSPTFAEIFVYVHPKGRGRGWGKSVVSACTAALLEDGLRPLYMVEEGNAASIQIAEGLGYVDSGSKHFVAEGRLSEMPPPRDQGSDPD
jgi:RimJ/RimL family protein N-acetyltransferase